MIATMKMMIILVVVVILIRFLTSNLLSLLQLATRKSNCLTWKKEYSQCQNRNYTVSFVNVDVNAQYLSTRESCNKVTTAAP